MRDPFLTVARAQGISDSSFWGGKIRGVQTGANLAFIESCVSLKAFATVDQFFAAALSHYRKHIHALNIYAEDQAHKGLTRAEILASI